MHVGSPFFPLECLDHIVWHISHNFSNFHILLAIVPETFQACLVIRYPLQRTRESGDLSHPPVRPTVQRPTADPRSAMDPG